MLEILEKTKVKAFMLAAILLELYLILPFESSITTMTILLLSFLVIYYKYRIWKIDCRINIFRSTIKSQGLEQTQQAVEKLVNSAEFRWYSTRKRIELQKKAARRGAEQQVRANDENDYHIYQMFEDIQTNIY